jgi:phosphoglucomutase
VTRIAFGTSGWRGIIADDFTFANLRAVAQAIADYVKEKGEDKGGIVVGYDCRFLGRTFATQAACVLAANGVRVLVSKRDAPTPAISYAVIRGVGSGAVNITASHNPAEYTGVKYSPKWGGPALPDATGWIEKRANELVASGDVARAMSEDEARGKGLWADVDLADDYLADLEKKVDFPAIASRGGTVAYDPLYSSGRGYLDRALGEHGIKVVTVHEARDPLFGGSAPDPSEAHLTELSKLVSQGKDVFLGLATDGDADRFGIVDGDGSFIEPNYVIALLLDYLIEDRGYRGGAARTVATTHLIDAVAKYHGVECYETPVGFKYIGQYIAADKIAAGGEESAGFSVFGHVPEKDGIIACLLVLEMVCRRKKTIGELLSALYERVGTFRTKRENLRLTEELDRAYGDRFTSRPSGFAGVPVAREVTIDGHKYILEDGSWILFRKSGTEPVVRIYGEASDDAKLSRLMKSAADFITKP